MPNVDQIVVVSILFSILLVAISITINHKKKSVNDEGLPRFLMFSYAYIAGIVCYIGIYLLSDSGSVLRYVLLLIIWCCYNAMLASMIMQCIFIFDYNKIWIKNITSILCYYSLLAVLTELFSNKFRFDQNSSGILFSPAIFGKGFYYGFPIVIFYICIIFLLINYSKSHTKIRERYLIKIAITAVIPALVGLVAESICQIVFNMRYPVFFIIMIVPFRFFSDLNIKCRSFQLKLSDFESLLKADNTDAVFICNDEQVVLYQNRAAEVNSKMYNDSFMGRKLSEIFIIDRDVMRAMQSKDGRNGLMVPAIYPITDNQVVMSVEFLYDCCDEILCYIITIPNYLVAVDEKEFEEKDRVEEVTERPAISYVQAEKPDNPHATQDKSSVDPNSNVLIVDDDIQNLEKYEALLKPYGVNLNKAIGGRNAIEMLLDPCYDAVFIAYHMTKLNGLETAKRIRSMGSGYYSDVPIIFILDEPVALVYKDLLSVSFNDYIESPISISKLNVIMGRWLWRRYAVTDKLNVNMGSSRSVRYIAEMSELFEDCMDFARIEKWDYMGYTIKGIKRLCSKLEDKKLIDACDNMVDAYIRGQYESISELLEAFSGELDRIKSSLGSNSSIIY
ncbi:MAG: response regulator [Lachnospiraceae bacterium]|nr:response regulator [Lachnospiraceae bacterium]